LVKSKRAPKAKIGVGKKYKILNIQTILTDALLYKNNLLSLKHNEIVITVKLRSMFPLFISEDILNNF